MSSANDVEKAQGVEPLSADSETSPVTMNEKTEPVFEPIWTSKTSRPGSEAGHRRSASVSRALSRTRSQNGYSCDDYPGDGSGDETLNGSGPAPEDHDPFEVTFEGGDTDAHCPRSMSTGRKWLIVTIVSGASFCV